MKVDDKLKFFLILTGGSAILFVASILLHNLLSAVLGFEEPVFFLIAVFVCPAAFLVGAIGSIILLIKRRG
ncbi:MAG: hypothetical protein V3T21_00735 [Candidatus Margulisiibacteriota bacterium]